ncbi:hypothetical protein GCM10027416_22270 [Okibacterium endophyticum]
MNIDNCPECGEITISAGLAFWPEINGPVDVAECAAPDCGWAGVEAEYWAQTEVHRSTIAA